MTAELRPNARMTLDEAARLVDGFRELSTPRLGEIGALMLQCALINRGDFNAVATLRLIGGELQTRERAGL